MGNFIINIINFIIKIFGGIISGILSVLPNSPFSVFNNSSVSEYLSGFAWIVPFGQIISLLELWTAAIIVYYVYQIVLRWLKVVA